MNRIVLRSVVFVIALVIGLISLSRRGQKVVDASSDLAGTASEVLAVLQSVRDAATAQTALPELKEKYPRIYKTIGDLQESAKAADGAGGISRDALDTLKQQVHTFQSVGEQIQKEINRLRGIRGLPIEFWDMLRTEQMKGSLEVVNATPSQFSPEIGRHYKAVVDMISEFGPQRVVQIMLNGVTETRAAELTSQLQSKLGPSAKASYLMVAAQAQIDVGPVDDFDRYARDIDFGEIAYQDRAQRLLIVQSSGENMPAATTDPQSVSATQLEAEPTERFGRHGGEVLPETLPGNSARERARASNGASHRSFDDLVVRFGKDRVVRVEITNSEDIVAQMDQTAAAISNAAPEVIACELEGDQAVVAPVNQFDDFCKHLDFAEIVARDDAGKTVRIKVKPAKVAAGATKAANRMAERFSGRNREMVQKMFEHGGPPSVVERLGFPSPSDPNYHKKLCNLMVDQTNWTLNRDAVDALLQINPHDIQDKDVRKQIARNFRDLAMKDGFNKDKGKAIQGLALYGGSFSVPILIELLENEKTTVPSELFDALASFPDARCAEAVSKKLGDFFSHDAAVEALRKMGPTAEDALMKAAPSNNANVSLAAVELLGEVGTQKSLTLLGKAAKSSNPEVREAAKEAMVAIHDRSRKSGRTSP